MFLKAVTRAAGDDRLFRLVLERVLRFGEHVAGATIPPWWYCLQAADAYAAGHPRMLMLAVLRREEDPVPVGHLLAFMEMYYGTVVGWIYQAELDPGGTAKERREVLTQGLAMAKDWARKQGATEIRMATRRPWRAWLRLLGWRPLLLMMALPLEDSNG